MSYQECCYCKVESEEILSMHGGPFQVGDDFFCPNCVRELGDERIQREHKFLAANPKGRNLKSLVSD